MINRILIRIKVIQILYSFLLVEKQFTLEDSPATPTKEKRFAYSLYMDMLVLMDRIARAITQRGGYCPLAETRFIKRIESDDTLRMLLERYRREDFPFAPALASLVEQVKESGIYKRFLKDVADEQSAAEQSVWPDLFNIIIFQDSQVQSLMRSREHFTLKGVDRVKTMINRTFVNFMASQDNVSEIVKALETSLDKARELYFRLLLLPVELTDLQERILDENKYKHLRTEEDINPNMRFVENRVVEALRRNSKLEDYVKRGKISWLTEEPVMMRKLLKAIIESDTYQEYMSSTISDINADAEFWRNIFKRVILENPDFLEMMEEKSVLWNDDLEIMSTFVGKTFRRIEEGMGEEAVLEKYKDEEDARFGRELISYVYKNRDQYRGLIDEAVNTGNWDTERLAFMDIVVLETALAEILNFPKIPLQASINEYIELAKSYSTAKSGSFVNGILGSVTARLRKEGRLFK